MATRQEFEDLLRKLDELEKRNLTSEQAAEVFELRGRINNVLKNYEFSRMLADIEIKFRDRIQKLEADVVNVTGSTKRKIQELISDIKETIEFFKELRRESEYENSEWNVQKETSSIFEKAKNKMASVRNKIKDFISDVRTMREAASEEQMVMEEPTKTESKGLFERLKQKTQEIKDMLEVSRDMAKEDERAEQETGKARYKSEDYDYAQERALEALHHYGM